MSNPSLLLFTAGTIKLDSQLTKMLIYSWRMRMIDFKSNLYEAYFLFDTLILVRFDFYVHYH
jgi:hypothetical protein